jgi:RimJ/RimL family protein N-acetyltransferase
MGAFDRHGFCRWALESLDGSFLGYTGIMPGHEGHPLGPHFEIGWRLVRKAWGQGYATEAGKAALDDAFTRIRLTEVIAYTAPDNFRSRAVMARLGMQRDPSRDFRAHDPVVGDWRGLVWFVRPA